MKLEGVRFKDFACFDECYVPLREGIQLLVGKNNAGKTALLRGLTALTALPIQGSQAKVFQGIGQYCRAGTQYPSFDLDILYSVGDADANIFGDLVASAAFKSADSRLLEFQFRVFETGPTVGFIGADLLFGSNRMAVAERSLGQAKQFNYNISGQRTNVAEILASQVTAGGEQWPILRRTSLTAALEETRNVQPVDAHRIVGAWNLQAVENLESDARTLAPFLVTLNGANQRRFRQIQDFVTSVFPEFEFVNATPQQNSVSVTLTLRGSDRRIPLTHCGTGVEQVLAIATFIFTSKPGTLLLLDEPHSYLHPTAERELVRLILEHPEHRYVISTHSAIFMNSIPPNRLLHLASSRVTPDRTVTASHVPEILHSLGYQNSDLLFNDQLIFVEGESDREILPRLLSISPILDTHELEKTGFPIMDGHGRLSARKKQASLIHYEKLLEQLSRTDIPRVYLFDGDCAEEGKKLVADTPLVKGRPAVAIKFLPRCEIENYLLVPEAIGAAIAALAELQGKKLVPDSDAIKAAIAKLLTTDSESLFPNGRGADPIKSVKASALLEQIFEEYDLQYNKRTTGSLIAAAVTPENQLALGEVWDLVKHLFPRQVRSA